MHGEIEMKVSVPVKELLLALRENREAHAGIVREARVGYIKKAQAQLKAALVELREGKARALTFGLVLPQDHTRDYDTVIGMLESTSDKAVVLGAQEYRQYVQDDWSWRRSFLAVNSVYSGTAAQCAEGDEGGGVGGCVGVGGGVVGGVGGTE